MDRNSIIALPNAHLRHRSRKVGVITDKIKKLVADMESATLDWEAQREHEVGVALAAIQVDIPFKVIVIRNDFDNKKNKKFTVFVNPVITKYEGEIIEDFEGCLSVPNIYGNVPRHSKIRVRALDLSGREFRVTAKDFLARVIQHEIDHTNGKVFIDLIRGKSGAFFTLQENGQLEQLNYEKQIRANSILW